MALRNIVVIGASAGGVRALRTLVGGLPADLPAALFVVLHTSPREKSMLPEILSHAGALPASSAEDGSAIENGRIYVAPTDRHMLLERGRVRVVFGPRENLFRPAIDPLFGSAANAYGAGSLAFCSAALWTMDAMALRKSRRDAALRWFRSPRMQSSLSCL